MAEKGRIDKEGMNGVDAVSETIGAHHIPTARASVKKSDRSDIYPRVGSALASNA